MTEPVTEAVARSPRDEVLFAYGSLLDAEVQRDTFGRVLDGDVDALPCYTVDYFEAPDERDLDDEGRRARPFVRWTGNTVDKVLGRAAPITGEELDAADLNANASFRRLAVDLTSGRRAWVYLRP